MAFTEAEEAALRGILAINKAKSAALSDDVALLAPGLYPELMAGTTYTKDERFTYKGELYYPNQTVTAAAEHTPDKTPTLYVKLSVDGDGIPVWSMDALASDPNAYNTGKQVHYPDAKGPVYTSKRDGNTSVPGTDQWWELAR